MVRPARLVQTLITRASSLALASRYKRGLGVVTAGNIGTKPVCRSRSVSRLRLPGVYVDDGCLTRYRRVELRGTSRSRGFVAREGHTRELNILADACDN